MHVRIMSKVLITTSGVGERLGKHTKHTNKSLVKVGDKYAICHIIETYSTDVTFVITLGHYGDYVKDFLDMAYPDRIFEYVRIDNYQGPGSSLGYSLLQARPNLQCPFIFHCCDAIVTEQIEFTPGTNTLYVAKVDPNLQYSSIISGADRAVLEINDKGCPAFDYAYTGISHIHDFHAFWDKLHKIYLQNPGNMGLSDVHAIKQMALDGCSFEYNVLSQWYDTGNLTSYYALKSAFDSKYTVLEKDNESLCFVGDKVIKFINDKDVNAKRIERGKLLHPHSPEIINHSANFLQMELVTGTVMSEVRTHGNIIKLLEWAAAHFWINADVSEKHAESCKRFYFEKTRNRLRELPMLKDAQNERMMINGLRCRSAIDIINSIPAEVLCTDTFYQYHGDFVLDNIIYSSSGEFVLIDWRHEFDGNLTHGDVYYDLAKLRHNLILNHKNVNAGLYDLEYIDLDSATVDLKCNYFHVAQLQQYDAFVNSRGFDLHKIRILTALIWLNMAPLYDGKFSEFLFYFGKYNLTMALENGP